MTVRLAVDKAAWRHHVATAAEAYGKALVPVIKGNGYGFGRARLHELAAGTLGSIEQVCVGTVHELADVPPNTQPVVLTPTFDLPARSDAILTVGSTAHAEVLRGRGTQVMVKLASSMRRFGATIDELPSLQRAVENLGLSVAGYALHLPLAGDDDARVAEIEVWLPHVPVEVPLWLSHLAPETMRALQAKYMPRQLKIRVGTALWHGVPKTRALQLRADVLHTQPIGVGEIAGYHHTPAPFDGTLVVIGAGSTQGVATNGDLSPFHFDRTRMSLLEPPHMHTSLAVVEAGASTPRVGEWVDLQRPLISTQVEDIEWH